MKWGILSTAEITGKVAPALRSVGSIVAVASRSVEKARAFAEKVAPNAAAYGSYAELLADENVEAVYIPLPSGIRNEWVLKAAEAKKHVYVEKPFAGDVDALVAACKKNNVQFMDGTMWVHSTRSLEIAQKLEDKKLGHVRRVTAAFSFMAPNDEWRNGGNGRTDKTREPHGCFGDQGWYSIGYEKPIRVQMIQTVKNDVDTIVRASGIVYFSDNRVGTFDCGCELAHRSWFEIAGTEGIIRVDDQVGGDSRTGNFNAYFVPFEGSSKYIQGTKEGKDEVVNVDPCDHVIALVQRFEKSATEGPDWSFGERTALQHKVMSALFESAENGGKIVEIQ